MRFSIFKNAEAFLNNLTIVRIFSNLCDLKITLNFLGGWIVTKKQQTEIARD